jgi:hypothetical protein
VIPVNAASIAAIVVNAAVTEATGGEEIGAAVTEATVAVTGAGATVAAIADTAAIGVMAEIATAKPRTSANHSRYKHF